MATPTALEPFQLAHSREEAHRRLENLMLSKKHGGVSTLETDAFVNDDRQPGIVESF